MKILQQRARTGDFGEDLIIRTAVRMLVPFIQLFSLYVLAHGHYSPGGGFQGGVLLGASFILLALAFDLKRSMEIFPLRANLLVSNVGALIFVGIGLVCALLGGFFLDYAALAALIPMAAPDWRSLGILLVEVGVALGVASIMLSLYWDLASGGNLEEGL